MYRRGKNAEIRYKSSCPFLTSTCPKKDTAQDHLCVMEKNMAILMADLAGYTALTETHGAMAAADLIEKYVEIVQGCLVGDSHLQERTGDEIMVISSSADDLFATTELIGKQCSAENNFLQIHGGLHFGKVLQRGNSFFGAAINLTSRIASKADAGSIFCSADFVNALSYKSAFPLTSKGWHAFKNISREKEIFELSIGNISSFFIDPVCRMLILSRNDAISHPTETGKYFCSPDCLHLYSSN